MMDMRRAIYLVYPNLLHSAFGISPKYVGMQQSYQQTNAIEFHPKMVVLVVNSCMLNKQIIS